jgi:hypothetical protein
MQKAIRFGAGLALAAFLTTIANASVVYDWVNTHGLDPSGKLTLSGGTGGTVSDLTFTLDGYPPDNTFSLIGTATVLPDQNLTLSGTTTGSGAPDVTWKPTVYTALEGENQAAYIDVTSGNSITIYGDWVPEAAVPEPTTIIAGASMLLPFGASALRMLRKRRTA